MYFQARTYRIRTALAVDVRMASYRAGGTFLQGDDGVDRCLAIAT